jgi:hypothetical protein
MFSQFDKKDLSMQLKDKDDLSLFDDSSLGFDDGADINPEEPIGDIDLEIVGLLSSTNGRCCSAHAECAAHVKVGDVLRLKETIVTIDNIDEFAIKCVKITDGIEGCTVAFVPKMLLGTAIVKRNINGFCVVKDLYCQSASSFRRAKSYRNLGMAGVVLRNKIPREE